MCLAGPPVRRVIRGGTGQACVSLPGGKRCPCSIVSYYYTSTSCHGPRHPEGGGSNSPYTWGKRDKIGNILKLIIYQLVNKQVRHGLVVRIAGSHPAGPGSIPGAGITVFFWVLRDWDRDIARLLERYLWALLRNIHKTSYRNQKDLPQRALTQGDKISAHSQRYQRRIWKSLKWSQ